MNKMIIIKDCMGLSLLQTPAIQVRSPVNGSKCQISGLTIRFVREVQIMNPIYRTRSIIRRDGQYLRLNKLFGRDFQETGLGGTTLYGTPVLCDGCGKYNELINWFGFPLFLLFLLLSLSHHDRIWRALNCGVYWKFIDHVRACTMCRAPIFPVSHFSLHFPPLSINNALLRI